MTSDYSWAFQRVEPRHKVREPIQGEFFTTEAISNPGEALIREGIQNALDAGDDSQPGRVTVRIFVSDTTGVPRDRIQPFVHGLWPHVHARDNGLPQAPRESDDCPFLVFEDFGTSGLSGDPAEWAPGPGVKNHFYHFFRAEGRSSKGDRDLGRWGIGKQVFPRASRINSVWGLTVRRDDRRKLLMGMAVFKSHMAGGHRYLGDGLLGARSSTDEPIPPIEDRDFTEQFERTFQCTRGGEPGLTIVVPWRDLDITADSLVRAAVRGFFWPILAGELRVLVEQPGRKITLDADSIVDEVDRLDPGLRDEVLPLLRLAQWARRTEAPTASVTVGDSPRWSADLFAGEEIGALRQSWQRCEPVKVRVFLNVTPKGKPVSPTHFDVFLTRGDGDSRGLPIFIREGIIIPDVRKRASSRLRGVRCLVVADHGPIATLLGDAENPAHTEWQKDGANFKGKYEQGAKVLDFVKGSPLEIVGALDQQDAVQDRTLLASVFSIPAQPTIAEAVTHDEKPTDKPGPVPEKPTPPQRRPRAVVIDKVDGGFVVRAGEAEQLPSRLVVRAAYQVRAGNPIKKYQPVDFEFSRTIRIHMEGAREMALGGNMLEFEVLRPDFRVDLVGFDPRRDVYVQVRPKEASDARTEA